MTLLCFSCEVQLHVHRLGVLVVQHADIGPSAIWKADEYRCPKCGNRIIANFATKPLAECWQGQQFTAVMNVTRSTPGNVVHCREFPDPVYFQ